MLDGFAKVIMPRWWAEEKTAWGWYDGRLYLLHPDHPALVWNGHKWLKVGLGEAGKITVR